MKTDLVQKNLENLRQSSASPNDIFELVVTGYPTLYLHPRIRSNKSS